MSNRFRRDVAVYAPRFGFLAALLLRRTLQQREREEGLQALSDVAEDLACADRTGLGRIVARINGLGEAVQGMSERSGRIHFVLTYELARAGTTAPASARTAIALDAYISLN